MQYLEGIDISNDIIVQFKSPTTLNEQKAEGFLREEGDWRITHSREGGGGGGRGRQ